MRRTVGNLGFYNEIVGHAGVIMYVADYSYMVFGCLHRYVDTGGCDRHHPGLAA